MTIFGVADLTSAYPEEHISEQNVSIGRAADGTFKSKKYRDPDRAITIDLQLITQTKMLALKAALEGAANRQGNITPDANIDYGAGAGTVITAIWMDKVFHAVRNTPFWNLRLNFTKL